MTKNTLRPDELAGRTFAWLIPQIKDLESQLHEPNLTRVKRKCLLARLSDMLTVKRLLSGDPRE